MDYNTWMAWAQVSGVHSLVIGFLRTAGDFSGATFNQWERVDIVLKNAKLTNGELEILLNAMLGEPATSRFMAFKVKADSGQVNLGGLVGGLLGGLLR